MDFDSLENMDKSEFLPLGTVKQELLDSVNVMDDETMTERISENTEINSATANVGASNTVETNNPVCDSAEKQVNNQYFREHFS